MNGFERTTVPIPDDPEGARISGLFRSGAGVPLVLVPGSYSAADQWTEVVEHLSPTLPLLLAEVRGHGASWPPPRNGSVEQFSDDLGNLVDALKFECFYVGGHSLGGMIALEYARTHADRVVGVLSAEGWTNRFAGQDAFESRAMDFLPSELRKRRDAEIAEVTANWSEDDREAFAPVWSRWDGAEFLRSTDTPVLHVYGDRGAPRPPISRLHIPDRAIFEFHWVPNVAHTLPWECPARLAALFTAFMREHAPKL